MQRCGRARLLDKLACVLGHDGSGALSAPELMGWIRKAQEICEANGRRRVCDGQIGQLLSNAPVGEDGVWPCEPVRAALDAVLNEDIETGFQIGRRNARGARWRRGRWRAGKESSRHSMKSGPRRPTTPIPKLQLPFVDLRPTTGERGAGGTKRRRFNSAWVTDTILRGGEVVAQFAKARLILLSRRPPRHAPVRHRGFRRPSLHRKIEASGNGPRAPRGNRGLDPCESRRGRVLTRLA